MLEEMKEFNNWVIWRYETDADGKIKKIPLNPKTGNRAKTNDSETWADYQTATDAIKKFKATGIGFEFSDSPFGGIDLDNCFNSKGELSAMADDIVKTVNSYTEYSPSEKGLHILFKLSEPIEGAKKIQGLGLEMYSEGRFFTITEKPFRNVKSVENRDDEVKMVHEKYWRISPSTPPVLDFKSDKTSGARCEATQNDLDLLKLMFHSSERGARIKDLFDGESAGYPSESEADLAFCHELAFYTGKDALRMDRIFRLSNRNRKKWDEKHDSAGRTYGEMTIEKAISSCYDIYNPKNQTQTISKSSRAVKVNDRMRDFFENVKATKEGRAISTGFENLDELLDGGLYPGLYFIGANSSLGKTSFLLQIADFIASSGVKVLYFSLEMSANELIARSLSRMTYNYDNSRGKTTRDILTARNFDDTDREIIKQCITDYKKSCGENLIFIEGVGDVGVDEIRREAEKHESPVIFIDYAQIIAPISDRKTDKQNVDANITALKRLSRDLGLPVVAISSFNRESYRESVSMASFKESGAIEYSSDVLIGLQYNGWDKRKEQNGKYESDTSRLARIDEISQNMAETAKNGKPQNIELKVLKNRNGARGKLNFEFYPLYNFFEAM